MFKLFGSIKDKKRKINMEGIGLGLVICQMIVKKFNGSINFVSEHLKGSIFYFTFELEEKLEKKEKTIGYNKVISMLQINPS